MIIAPILLLLAQAAMLPPAPVPPPSMNEHLAHTARKPRHAAPNPTPTPTPEVRITIVNATSVPTLTLHVMEGKALRTYPCFPQGEWTANEAISSSEIQYLVQSSRGIEATKQTIRFKPRSSQFLLLTGDPSSKGPTERLPQINQSFPSFNSFNFPTSTSTSSPTSLRPHAWPSNLQFHLFPYTLVSKDPCHYRIFNAMPGKSLLMRSVPTAKKPSQQLALLAPGSSVHLTHQPASIDYEVVIDGQSSRLEIRQEGAIGNCLIPFFLRNGKPDFIQVFETP